MLLTYAGRHGGASALRLRSSCSSSLPHLRLRRRPCPAPAPLPTWQLATDSASDRAGARRTGSSSSAATVPVASERLEQLLEAEITTLSLREPQLVTLQSILELPTESREETLAQLLHEEVAVRFAKRIKMLEALPDWESKVSIATMRRMFVRSFKELRLVDPSEQKTFEAQIGKIVETHKKTDLLVKGLQQYARVKLVSRPQIEAINDWLDQFFQLRISANMLMSQYLHVTRGYVSKERNTELDFDPGFNPYESFINPNCSMTRIVSYAAHVVDKICRLHYGVAPRIIVTDQGAPDIPAIPRHVFYIFSEILKNSVRATVELHSLPMAPESGAAPQTAASRVREDAVEASLPPIEVLVSGDEHVVTTRISDQGGGIPSKRLERIWDYLYTTGEPIDSPLARNAVDAPADLRRLLKLDGPGLDIQDTSACADGQELDPNLYYKAPLAGTGCGLPLSRLYATYLGGTFDLETMPSHGTDAFVYLRRWGSSSVNPPSL